WILALIRSRTLTPQPAATATRTPRPTTINVNIPRPDSPPSPAAAFPPSDGLSGDEGAYPLAPQEPYTPPPALDSAGEPDLWRYLIAALFFIVFVILIVMFQMMQRR
ncbi:MAG: hypothetical protein HC876_11305, partial [Chloroflexaceae bacterium]|nr:hypothetical protein [Chloroflexaceae bacterium]